MHQSAAPADGEGSTNSIHTAGVCHKYSSPKKCHHSLSVPPSSVVSGEHQRTCQFLLMLFAPNKDNTRPKPLAKEVMLRRPEVWVSYQLLGLGQVGGSQKMFKAMGKGDKKKILLRPEREKEEKSFLILMRRNCSRIEQSHCWQAPRQPVLIKPGQFSLKYFQGLDKRFYGHLVLIFRKSQTRNGASKGGKTSIRNAG